ncbi:tyrosine-type recombinase/integrase [Rhodococcoides fascians]|uniref:tyrosine-type recombinase/integrase n=1 Tax=Rhodococcoides fascians TaxID=1828 RepID=UPI00055DE2C2|nr:tyrosine-type recombinase/integrase [Rhodococcus fascians]
MTAALDITIPHTGRDALSLDLFCEAFLMRWDGNTQISYRDDLKMYRRWCDGHGLHVFDARRQHIEVYMRYLADERRNSPSTISHRIGTLRLFYEIALDDDCITKNPARLLKMPKIRQVVGEKIHLDRNEMQAVCHQAYESSATDYALLVIMGYTGLRVSEACSLDVENVTSYSQGHRIMQFVQKGGEIAVAPQPPVVMRAIDRAIGDRKTGALLLRRDGTRMTRHSADRVAKRIVRKTGIQMNVSPHTFRHSFCVNAIDAGVPLREVQLAMRHADISTTIRIYDRGRRNLDTHASHSVAAYLGAVA